MEGADIWIDDLAEQYPYTETRELDKLVRALGRGWITKDIFEQVSPSISRNEIGESLKRLFDRGYLTNIETQDTIKLFGGWL